MKQRKRSAAASSQQNQNRQDSTYQEHTHQTSQNMQKRQPIQGGELPAESVHEMPGRPFSIVMSNSRMNYQIHPLSATTPSSTSSPYSPPHSPPIPAHSPTYSYQGQSSAQQSPSYAVIPPCQPQHFNQQSGPSFPTLQESYSHTQLAQTVPQQCFAPQPQSAVYYPPPPQDDGLYTPEIQQPSIPGNGNVRRREIGSGSASPGISPELIQG